MQGMRDHRLYCILEYVKERANMYVVQCKTRRIQGGQLCSQCLSGVEGLSYMTAIKTSPAGASLYVTAIGCNNQSTRRSQQSLIVSRHKASSSSGRTWQVTSLCDV